MKQKLTLLLLLILSTITFYAQEKCGFENILSATNANPISKINFDSIRSQIRTRAASIRGGNNPYAKIQQNNYVIPVVVHLVGTTPSAMTDAQVLAQINLMNSAFSNSLGSTYSSADDTQIKFCLAQKLPDGSTWSNISTFNSNLYYNSTSGITRCTTSVANNLTGQHCMDVTGSFGQQSLVNIAYGTFNSNNYLNIWVVEQISETASPYLNYVVGYAPFPIMGPAAGLDGIVMRLNGFGINSGGFNYNQGGTLIHEAGHYLGLFHTFQNGCSEVTYSLACNSGGDECCDTPPVAAANQNSCSVLASSPPNSCSESPDFPDMYENHMDYAYDLPGTCRNTFTNDQADRMHATIQLHRSNLVSFSNHVVTGLTLPGGCQANAINPGFATDLPNAGKQICVGQSIGFTTGSAASTYTWTFSGATPSVAVGTYSPTGIVYSAAGVYTVTLNITDGSGNNYNSSMQIYVSNCNALASNRANWYFGYFESVSFATGIAVAQSPSAMRTMEASSAISDASGNLLFYTDGRNVFNNTHATMANGAGTLNGSLNGFSAYSVTSSAQGVVIVPRPANPNKYYVYTTSDAPINAPPVLDLSRGVSQYEVDMTTSLGTVTSTVPVHPTNNYATNEPIIAIPHCNGTDYWLVVKPINNNQNGLPNAGPLSTINQYIASYSVTSAGISNTPVLSLSSPYVPTSVLTPGTNNGIGHIAVSPDKSMIAIGDITTAKIYLYYFDCSNGKANYLTTLNNIAGYGFAFSPNSKVLYARDQIDGIIQYDLSNLSICNPNPPSIIFDCGVPGSYFNSLQLGPDNRIYVSHFGKYFLSVINFPNSINLSASSNDCGYNPAGIPLNNPNYPGSDLPNDINSQTGQTTDDFSYCVSNCSQAKFANLGCGTTFAWNFGDGYSTSGTNTVIPAGTNGGTTSGNYEYPVHTYSATGTYVVTLSIDGRTSVTYTVTFSAPSIPAISGSTLICSTNTTSPASYFAPVGYTYNWAITNGTTSNSTQQAVNVSWINFPAVISLTITNNEGCSASNSLTVNSTNSYTASASPNSVCSTKSVTLTATGTASYTWQPSGLTGNTVVVTPTANTVYTVTGLTPNLCSITNTVLVTVISNPTLSVNSPSICAGTSTVLTASGANTYSWSTSATTNSILVTPGVTTVYTVTGTNTLTGCSTTKTVQVSVYPSPTLSVNNSTICSGASTALTVSGANTYSWSTGEVSDLIAITPSVTTNYTVVGTNTLTGCKSTTVATVFVNPLPTATLTPNGSISLCGSQTITLNAISNVDPNTTYAWTYNGAGVGSGHNINVSLAGSYQVVITNTITGCEGVYSTPVYSAPNFVCDVCLVPNGNFEYAANLSNIVSNITDAPFWNSPTNGSPDYYNTGMTLISGVSIPNSTFASGTPDHTGNVSQAYGGFISYSTNVSEVREYIQTSLNCALEPNQKYNVSMWARAANGTRHISNNVGIHLSNTSITGTSNLYTFTPQLNFTSLVPATTWTQLTGTITGSSANFITIGNFYNDAATTFSVINAGSVFQNAYYFIDDVSITPAAPSVSAGTVSCITSGSAVTLTLSGSPGYFISNGITTQTLNAATGTITVTPTVTTTYTIIPNLVCNKCNIFSTITISVSPVVTANSVTICSGTSTVLTASGATTYSWNTGATTNTISVSPAVTTIYTVTGTTNGCSNTKTVSVTVKPTPTVAVNNASICVSTSTILTASGATTYSWNTGATTNTLSVSPSATTIYTVTGTTNGCTNTKTVSVTIKPTPTIAVNNATICSVTSTVLTASGATTYSWNTSATTNTISVSPAVTTIYTVTGTTNGCSNTKTVSVTVVPVPTITVNSATICPGSPATLTANGAAGYTWSPGASTLTTIVVTPTATTVYTVTGQNLGCNITKTTTASVTVIPATFTLNTTASTLYSCESNSITLTANALPIGTYTYNWSAPITQTTSVVTFTPVDNKIYTCNVTNACGSTQTSAVCVNIVGVKCCNAVDATLDNLTLTGINAYSNLSSGVYKIQNTITITGNVTWANIDFRMMEGARILIKAGAKLKITNCQLYSCTNMWEGIVLESGLGSGTKALIEVTNSSIEDAYKAISLDLQNDGYDGNIKTTGSTFNKNYIGINIINTSGSDDFKPVLGDNFLSQASISSPGSSLKCSSFYSPTIKSRAFAGVNLINQTGNMHVGDGGLNPSNLNTFSNLDYGVKIDNSTVRVFKSNFINMTGPGITYFPPPPAIGVGVYSTNTLNNTIPHFHVNNCNFTNVNIGISAQNIDAFFIDQNNFSTTVPTPLYTNYLATYAIQVSDYNRANVESNVITNFINAINFNHTVPVSPTYSLNIFTNTITANAGGYCSQAITLQSAANNYTAAISKASVFSNSISNVYNGVYANNIKNGLRISNNTIAVQYNTTGLRAGIKLTGTQTAIIDYNAISSTNTANTNLRGIYMQLSPGCSVRCNSINSVGQSAVFEGNCSSPTFGFANNLFTNANDGLVLKTNGIIGTQGITSPFINFSSGNQWLGTFTNSKTLVMDAGSSAQYSNLIVKNNSNEYPQPQSLNKNAGSALTNIDNFGIAAFNSPASIFTVTSANLSCPAAQTTGYKIAQPDSATQAYEQAVNDSALYNLLAGPNADAVIIDETKEINRSYVYNVMAGGYATAHTGLKAFYAAQADSSTAAYHQVDSLLQQQNYYAAQNHNAQAATSTQIQYNQQLVNKALINYGTGASAAFTQSEIDDLTTLANTCPLQQGTSVYQARSLLCVLLNSNIEFKEDCEFESKASGKRAHSAIATANPNSFNLYPNPNNGTMYLKYHVVADAIISLFDVSGRLLYKNNINSNNSILQIQTTLSEGVYFYTITDGSDKVLKTDKLIIMK